MGQPDIRDPEHLLEEARANLASLRGIVFGFGEAQTMIRSMSGVIRYWSHGAERLYGWSRDEAVGRSALELLGTICAVSISDITDRLHESGIWRGELIHHHRNGQPVHVTSDWVLQDEGGVENIIDISNDISDRVSADATRLLYAAVVADSQDAIITKTLDGIVTTWNRAAETMFGWNACDIIGKSINAIIPPDRLDEELSILARLHAGQRVESFETIRQRRDGRPAHVALTVSPIRDRGGQIIGASKMARDIGRQRQTDAALQRAQRMETIAQLTGGVAHDFNNLLGVIIANVDVLRPSLAHDPALLGIVDDILAAAEGGSRLTSRLVNLSQQRATRLEPIDIGAYLNTYTELLRRTLGGAIVITTEFAANLWIVRADPSQIGDAMINLALNARDAMPGTGGWLQIKIANVARPHHRAHPGDFVVLSVTDDGGGMSPDVLAHALEPFFTTKPENIGNGLGLGMVQSTMTRHDGFVEIESVEGVGTTVRLLLPREAKTDAKLPRQEANSELPVGTEMVLVVDDNELLRMTVVRTLKSLGYRTTEASTGVEALALLQQGLTFDLLLTDVIMPGGLGGSQLVAQAKQLRPGIKSLLTTGFARPDDIAGEFQGTPVLSKPYRRRILAEMVRAVLDDGAIPGQDVP
jgi:PAS domain S-box-containing protein